jgi:tryptophanyl-tRNA synthetase
VRVFSGIRASGDKTLGNYSGGFRQYVRTQDEALAAGGEAVFCVVDMHSITTPFEPETLRESTLSVFAWLLATGLDPDRSTVFVQSHVPAHAEGAWLLGGVTAWGELRRMTQFKDRAEEQDFVSAGLFNYPVLMAADILLYDTDIVPVGDDQRQHVELTRDIAERFNQRFGETLVVPRGRVSRGRRAREEPPGARAADVDVARGTAGRRAADRRPRRDPEEVQDRGDRLRPRGQARPREQAGRVEPDRDHGRRDR